MTHSFSRLTVIVVAVFVGALGVPLSGKAAPPLPPLSSNASVFVSGLNNPRGLKFGPDGNLYVAEGGVGGTESTVGTCTQVVPPIGPYTGSRTGSRISKITPAAQRSTAVDGLPSSQTSPASGSLVSGVEDVVFLDGTLYALIIGAGCSHGVAGIPNGVIRVNADGTWTQVADFSAFVRAHPVAHPEPDDFEPDESSYSMTAAQGKLYVVESNHGALDEVSTDGTMRRMIDISASQGHVVPTAIAYHDGAFYVGNLAPFPVKHGKSVIYKITAEGQISVAVPGLAAVLGVAFDRQGTLYVLETSTVDDQPPVPGTGDIVRVRPNGTLETVATGLVFPTGITFGPDGQLYVSNFGFGFPPGMGQIVRVKVQASAGPPLPNTGVAGHPVTFPQTGYSLDGDFLAYWQPNGGLPVFGYPIDSAREVGGHVSQWLERARFELHPENAAPYNILLGRLGVEALEQRRIDWRTLPKDTTVPAGCRSFATTGHTLCGDFLQYWQSHGLQIDSSPAVSEAESLALFGYPISSARMETNANGETVLTQWFERARFEYHPDKPAPYRVLLGRLGAEVHPSAGQ